MGKQTLILVTISSLLFVQIAQANPFEYANDDLQTLSLEDQDVADAARLNVAETLENNLIKFFTLFVAANNEMERSPSKNDGGVTTAGKRGGFERQKDKDRDEEEEEEAEEITTSTTEPTTTKKPSAFPQVVQILSAIFSGGLNLTNIVDRTFGLAPESLRNQVDGLFKLLTGQPPAPTTTTTPKPTTKKPTTKTPLRRRTTSTTTESENESELDYETELSDPPTTTTEAYKTLIRNRYKLGNRTRNTSRPGSGSSSSSAALMLLPDDEMDTIFRLEEKLVLAAIEAEPYVRDKEPGEFRGVMEAIIKNFDSGKLNVTQIIKFVPDLFEGARESILVLEKLGQIPKQE